jgi:hypothetical protein
VQGEKVLHCNILLRHGMNCTSEDHAIENRLRRRHTNIAPDDVKSLDHNGYDRNNDDEASVRARTAFVRGD